MLVAQIRRHDRAHLPYFSVAQGVLAAAPESGADCGITYLPRNNVAELDCHQRRNIVVRIRIVRIAGTERRSGKKKHQAENSAAKITMTKQKHSFIPHPAGLELSIGRGQGNISRGQANVEPVCFRVASRGLRLYIVSEWILCCQAASQKYAPGLIFFSLNPR